MYILDLDVLSPRANSCFESLGFDVSMAFTLPTKLALEVHPTRCVNSRIFRTVPVLDMSVHVLK
jgi:hypothetical protein